MDIVVGLIQEMSNWVDEIRSGNVICPKFTAHTNAWPTNSLQQINIEINATNQHRNQCDKIDVNKSGQN